MDNGFWITHEEEAELLEDIKKGVRNLRFYQWATVILVVTHLVRCM